MFNREYQRRAARQALTAAGLTLAQDDSNFYRPAKRVHAGVVVKQCKERSGKLQGLQLELFPDRPLADLFPEAYQ